MKDLFDRGRHRRRASGAGFRMTRVRVLVVLAAAMFMLLVPAGGYAIHDTGAFELDGNAVTAHGAGPPDDWDRVCHQVVGSDCSTSSNTVGAGAVSWTDDGALNATIFTGGGS